MFDGSPTTSCKLANVKLSAVCLDCGSCGYADLWRVLKRGAGIILRRTYRTMRDSGCLKSSNVLQCAVVDSSGKRFEVSYRIALSISNARKWQLFLDKMQKVAVAGGMIRTQKMVGAENSSHI